MNNFLIFFVGFFGLCVGSFLNVVIYRLPRNMPFVFSRSRCTNCRMLLKWYHNIPLFSFIALRGKCAGCQRRISWRYPLVEFLNAGLWSYYFLKFGVSVDTGIYCLLASILLVVVFIDLDFKIIQDSITLSGMVIGLAVSLLPSGMSFIDSLLGLIVAGGSMYLIAMLGEFLFKKETMGGGDIKLMSMLGTFLGWKSSIVVIFTSAFIGLAFMITVMVIRRNFNEHRVIPFGPFIAVAALFIIEYGDTLISLYLGSAR